jgi:hypothetical protein
MRIAPGSNLYGLLHGPMKTVCSAAERNMPPLGNWNLKVAAHLAAYGNFRRGVTSASGSLRTAKFFENRFGMFTYGWDRVHAVGDAVVSNRRSQCGDRADG